MCVSLNWVTIDSDNGLLPVWHQAITWNNADLLSFGPFATGQWNMDLIYLFFQKIQLNCCLQNVSHFVQASMGHLPSRLANEIGILYYWWDGKITKVMGQMEDFVLSDMDTIVGKDCLETCHEIVLNSIDKKTFTPARLHPIINFCSMIWSTASTKEHVFGGPTDISHVVP